MSVRPDSSADGARDAQAFFEGQQAFWAGNELPDLSSNELMNVRRAGWLAGAREASRVLAESRGLLTGRGTLRLALEEGLAAIRVLMPVGARPRQREVAASATALMTAALALVAPRVGTPARTGSAAAEGGGAAPR